MRFFRLFNQTMRRKAFRRNLFVMGTGLLMAFVDRGYAIETKIAFSSTRDGNSEIYMVDTDGTNLVRLTRHPAIDAYPTWSSDGTKIAFTSNRRNGSTHEIYVMNADGKRPIRLTTNNQPVPAYDKSPSWSPDGAKIAFASNREGNSEIYVMDANGKNIVRLTRTIAREATPAWSPDGAKIAYVFINVNADSDIYVMNANGGQAVNLTKRTRRVNETPSWSPDGDRIVFQAWDNGNHDIYVMDADGRNILRLTHHFAWDAYPAWSPNGRVIAFTSLRNLAGEEIFLIHPDGTNLTQITKSVGRHMARSAAWSPAPQPVSLKEKLVIQLGRVKQSR